jgi:hypothetical protein
MWKDRPHVFRLIKLLQLIVHIKDEFHLKPEAALKGQRSLWIIYFSVLYSITTPGVLGLKELPDREA